MGNIDRLLFVGLYRFSPKVLDALKILKPETVLCWHRADLRAYGRRVFDKDRYSIAFDPYK